MVHRRVKLAALCAVLGVATALGVAWWVSWRAGLSYAQGWSDDLEIYIWKEWPPTRQERWMLFVELRRAHEGLYLVPYRGDSPIKDRVVPTEEYIEGSIREVRLPRGVLPGGVGWEDFDFAMTGQGFVQAGWPARCVYSRLDTVTSEGNQFVEARVRRWSVRVMSHPLGEKWGESLEGTIPIRPLWIGLGINTAVYGSAWWMVLWTPGAARRWSRRGRGRCEACGYDLSGVERCPECGAGAA